MLRGILTGLIFGGVVGLVVAAVLSLLSPLPATLERPLAESPSASQPAAPANVDVPGGSQTDAPVEADVVAQAPAPATGRDSAPNADRAPAPKPQPGAPEAGALTPAPIGEAPATVQDDVPVLPSPQAQPITAPGAENEPSISVDPAQPQSPATPETAGFGAPEPTPAPRAPTGEGEAARGTAPKQQDTPITADAAPEVDTTAPEAIAALEGGALLKPAQDLSDAFPQRTSSRLPRIGDAPETEAVEAVTAPEAMPLRDFAQAFDYDGEKPLMSVLLLDDPDSLVDLATLADFPIALSVAIDALHPEAAARAAAYRGFGIEVFSVVNLPQGVSASEIEVNLAGQLAAVPQAVGLLEGLETGLQESRAVAEQVIAYAGQSGHGLVLQPQGLNTAQKLAVREGVPALTVFRDFDSKGQTEVVMRRFLDQAAFKARQSSGVVMMGRLQPITIQALASWALQDRASTVAIAPVSALLLAQQDG
ncbi:divergent polysaccharide deacetylase family protein [Cognatishimia sp. SS12]|uniref:polysaccharide deacteylase family 2 protein n=1 Tax=Cognatishimia sp. SS12 TaxID=2979465 RepID=UPI00232FD867|nr:polysaccharide deacteylase family 2 protein [Cognatishimia sp. SS12]MDC0737438.1 divergent polysaccharide deacetylase family protein [Cognatishimia sp. SS12]